MTATVIGCVWGAHRTLAERFASFGEAVPTYEWCEQQWAADLRQKAPGDSAVPAWLTQELFFRWRTHVRTVGQQQTLDLGGVA